MSASTAERTGQSAIVSGMGLALLKALPTSDRVQDRSGMQWGDFETFATNESQIYTPTAAAAPIID